MTDLNLQIEELISKNATDFQISKVIKTYYKDYLDSIDTTVETTGGKDFFIKHTKHTDKFLILLYKYILRKNFGSHQPMSSSVPISLIALGSYGREQLCIYSDIDIMLLYENTKGYNLKDIMEEFITLAWDCGLKLGSRVHELKEIIRNLYDDDDTINELGSNALSNGAKFTDQDSYYEKVENVFRKLQLM